MEIEDSILQKLRNKAKEKGVPFQLLLQLFCQEEFLRRVSKSKYKNNLIFKRGLLLFSLSNFESRPTMDIDFLGRDISNDQSNILSIISSVIGTPSEYSFITFEIVGSENIAEGRNYSGARVKVIGHISNTKTPFKIDIGIGDIIVPAAQYTTLKPQLDNFPETELLSYSLESVIAEKWEIIISRMETSSRMKDYYDIYYLACSYDFDGEILQKAISETLVYRGVSFDISTIEKIAMFHKDRDMQNKWSAFIRKTLGIELEFQDVLKTILALLYNPTKAFISGKSFHGNWSAEKLKY
jgi:predicted nucleotidyltransferase component of viral defense system